MLRLSHLSMAAVLAFCLACSTDSGKQADDALPAADQAGEVQAEVVQDIPADPTPPVISGLAVIQNPLSVLSATLELETDETAAITLQLDGAGKKRTIRFHDEGTTFVLPVLGLRAETTYTLYVTATNSSGVASTAEPMEYKTPQLPLDVFPPRQTLLSKPEKMQPGITIYSSMVLQFPLSLVQGLIMAIDEAGEVIWYYRDPENPIESFHRMADGSLLFLAGFDGAVKTDMLGNSLNRWHPVNDLGLERGFHHDAIELPDGNIVAIGVEMRDIEQQTDQGPVVDHVMGDTLVEFTPEGEVVHVWSTFDLIETSMKKEDYNDPFWDQFVKVEGGTKDWLHANCLAYDASDDSILMSLRHIDWIIKVDRKTGKRIWAMGEGGDFQKLSGEWFYHQHSIQMLAPGHIMLFDNGNRRPGYEWIELWSRALEFTYDEEAMTWTQVWEWTDSTPYFSQFVSDSDRLPNGNVLVADGGRVKDQSLDIMVPKNSRWSRLVEVTDDGEIVFEMEQKDLSGDVLGYTIYRAQRWDSLYPANVATETVK